MPTDPNEFELLLAAHGNGELTTAERARLAALAAGDPVRSSAVAEVDAVLAAFAAEHELAAALAVPAEPREEADEGYRRLLRRAAAAEDELRARLRHPRLAAVRRGPARWWIVAAAAAVVAASWWALRPVRPALLDAPPSDSRLGAVARIHISAVLRAADPVFRWDAQAGARTYDARLEGGGGEILARRGDSGARGTEWRLAVPELAAVRTWLGAGRQLVLRVVARDGAGTIVGSTGDRPVTLIE